MCMNFATSVTNIRQIADFKKYVCIIYDKTNKKKNNSLHQLYIVNKTDLDESPLVFKFIYYIHNSVNLLFNFEAFEKLYRLLYIMCF